MLLDKEKDSLVFLTCALHFVLVCYGKHHEGKRGKGEGESSTYPSGDTCCGTNVPYQCTNEHFIVACWNRSGLNSISLLPIVRDV